MNMKLSEFKQMLNRDDWEFTNILLSNNRCVFLLECEVGISEIHVPFYIDFNHKVHIDEDSVYTSGFNSENFTLTTDKGKTIPNVIFKRIIQESNFLQPSDLRECVKRVLKTRGVLCH